MYTSSRHVPSSSLARAGLWQSGRQMNWINCSVTSNCQYLYPHQLERVAAETVKTIFTRSPFRKIFILKHPSFSSKKLNFNVVLNFKRLFLWCLLTLISQLLASFSMFDIRELNISMDGWWLSTISGMQDVLAPVSATPRSVGPELPPPPRARPTNAPYWRSALWRFDMIL